MYNGYLSFAGTELMNAERTEAYCANQGIGWFKGCESCADLHMGLGDDEGYNSPIQDEASWVDPDNADTWRFYGMYPLDIQGIDDSVVTASVTDAISDGGVVSVPRAGTRTITVSAMLIGEDEGANTAGMNWLRGALRGSPCGPQAVGCTGDDLCFLSACPDICGDSNAAVENCLDDYSWHLHKVTTIDGPHVTAKHHLNDGGSVWEVAFTMVAAVPWVCGEGTLAAHATSAVTDPHRFKTILNVPTVTCPAPSAPTYRDPHCVALPKPPGMPTVKLNCGSLPTNWDRYSLVIPAALVPQWGSAVPELEIVSPAADPMRNVRVRFYVDPLNRFEPEYLDECGFCSEFLVTYIPPNYAINISGMDESITMYPSSYTEEQIDMKHYNAAQVVTSTDNSGFEWPALTCGSGYVLTLDVPHGAAPPREATVSIYKRWA